MRNVGVSWFLLGCVVGCSSAAAPVDEPDAVSTHVDTATDAASDTGAQDALSKSDAGPDLPPMPDISPDVFQVSDVSLGPDSTPVPDVAVEMDSSTAADTVADGWVADSSPASDTEGAADTPTDATTTPVDIADADDGVTADSLPGSDADATPGPADDLVQLNHIQALGTHNSYHIEPPAAWLVPQWAYTHLPLAEQAEVQGVRQFELDLYYDAGSGTFDVLHLPIVDPESNCTDFTECLTHLKAFSDQFPSHHPMVVLMELKSVLLGVDTSELLADLEARVLNVWPTDRLVRPDDVQGDAGNVRDAIADSGWPTLSEIRGRLLLVLHADGELRDVYTDELTTTEGRLFFPDCYGDTSLPVAAVHSINGPVGSFDTIQAVVAAGHLVRTRSDSDSEETDPVDYTRFQAALDSGAHFVSTDYPFPGDDTTYGVVIPEGTPSRCNPLTALTGCTANAIESL